MKITDWQNSPIFFSNTYDTPRRKQSFEPEGFDLEQMAKNIDQFGKDLDNYIEAWQKTIHTWKESKLGQFIRKKLRQRKIKQNKIRLLVDAIRTMRMQNEGLDWFR